MKALSLQTKGFRGVQKIDFLEHLNYEDFFFVFQIDV